MTTPNTAGGDKVVAALRASLAETERLRRQNQQLLASAREPVAIVAMACRLPGGVRSPEDLWRLVDGATDAMSGFPADRGWDLDNLHDPDPDRPGTSYVRDGGFVHDAGEFDAELFGISPREALAMDPQQRLLLETAWELLERAGMDAGSLRGRAVGTFVGSGHSGYGTGLEKIPEGAEGYSLTGSTSSVVSGRVAYTFGFEGPAVTIDTACSSSLVALHLAAQALRQGECDLALAGGVAVMATPFSFTEFSRQRGLAADGRCKPFAAAADGTGWGEGAGLLLLERLSDARRNGHRVLAVVRGSAVNQDGASNGLTAPNGPAQQRVIRQALANAGVSPSDVDAVEAHGTGTRLGDPIEAHALIATYGQDRDADRPLWLGSVKSNIGHTQYAAGVAGVIKTVMAMQRGVLPRTLHVDEPSPHVDWTAGHVELLTRAQPWTAREDRPRRAGVSAFGISGTNAHVILEQAVEEAEPAREPGRAKSGLVPWVVSARNQEALVAQARRLAGAVGGLEPVDVGWSLATGRAALERRAVVWGADADELKGGLLALADGVDAPGLVEGRLAVLFTGQGAQRARMGAGLTAAFPVFAEALEEVCAGFDGLLPRPLGEVLAEESGTDLEQTVFTQAGLFAVEVALWRLVRSWGVRPDFVAGHSIGELTAAHVAGVFDLGDACRLVAARGRLMQALPPGGSMLAVQAGLADVEQVVEPLDGVDIAAVNGPNAVVVSGAEEAVDQVREHFKTAGVKTRRLAVSHAFHSSLMDPMLADFEKAAAGVTYHEPETVLVSNLTGRPAGEEIRTAAYWVRHVREAVRFGDSVQWLAEAAGVRTFLELGPDATLAAMAAECLPADSGAVFAAATRRDHDEVRTLTAALSHLWCTGTAIDWPAFFTAHGPRRVELPTYAFQRRHFWLTAQDGDAPAPADPAEAGFWAAVERQDAAALAETLADGAHGAGDEEALRGLLPALSTWRRRQRESSALDACRYAVSWQPLPPREPALGGRWLVVVPERPADPPFVDAVCAAVAAAGAAVETAEVRAGEAVRLELADHLAELAADGAPPEGVLSLLACAAEDPLDATRAPDASTPSAASDDPPYPLAATLSLLQALGDAGVDAPLWCATRNAVAVASTDPAPVPDQAAVWGLGRVAALELPHAWGGLVDLPAALDERAGRLLAAALAAGGEDQVAVRPAGLHARRLVHAPAAAAGPVDRPPAWPPAGTVLVTGGTGALGAHVARALAAAGAPHLLLVSRGGPQAPGADTLADDLRRAGARVTVAACDAADRDRLADVLAGVPDDLPLRAVVHTAGVVEDGILASLTPETLRRVLRPKAAAARNLHELTLGRDLDAFVLFSSFSGTAGTPGQAAYAAANAYLDALAEQRRAAGLPALSVAWGPWSGGGMAGERAAEAAVRRGGLTPLPPERGLAALDRALVRGDTAVAVVDADWPRFAAAFTANRPSPLLTGLPEVRAALRAAPADAAAGGSAGGGGAGELVRRLAALPEADRARAVLDLVRDHVAAVLGHASAQGVPPDRPFKDLGFDSLTAVNLRNRLATYTGLHLPATLVFDHPTATALARHLTGRLLPETAAEPAPPAPSRAPADGDPIAIVSMACRFPGDVTSPEELWRLLDEGRDAITRCPDDRGWDIDDFYDPDPAAPGRTYGREGGFVRDAAMFDAAFFGISPREAVAMDPQQRLLLESSWEVVERAGIDPLSLRGSRTGVFVGLVPFDYAPTHGPGLEELEGLLGTGTSSSVASGRVAYTLGLEGQAVTIDTACSSSLVALHLAARALRQGECDLALAGGVTVLPSPSLFIEFSRQRGLSADGRCKAFSAAANGFGPAEGVGVLLLERLSDARRNGHRVLAVVKGSAVNQDGASNGLTAPNGPSQQRVIRDALADAGLGPADVDAVEAHGTGTNLGDPIEAQALLATYGQDRPADRPLRLGSVKSNIGHTQAAAGMAGVIKMVMAMREGVLPRTLHADEPSPHVDWSSGAVSLLTRPVPWTAEDGRPRRAGVSSFGISGTNAHVILEAADEPAPQRTAVAEGPALRTAAPPWLLSARDPDALRAQAARIAEHAAATGADPADIGWALLTRRAHLEHRAAVHGTTAEEVVAAARALAEGEPAEGTATGRTGATGGVTFVFPGQGSQWVGMGRELLAASPVFAARLAECDAALTPHTGWSVTGLLTGGDEDTSWMERTEILQPLLWAVMVSLAAVWESLGVVPSAVIGHSQGEAAAAVVAGALSLEDGARVITARSSLAGPLVEEGSLLTAAAGAEWIEERLTRWSGALAVAAVNGPSGTVVSGPLGALDELAALLEEEGVWYRRVTAAYASHSPMMEPLREKVLAALHGITPRPSRIPMVSTVTGELQDTAAMDAGYWYANLRHTVQFRRAVEAALGLGHTTVLEVSAHPVLTASVRETAEAAGVPVTAVGTLRRDDGGPARLTAGAAELWTAGVPVDWRPLYAGRALAHTDLPTYPFQRRRYWLQAQAAGDPAGLGLAGADHPLLGATVRLAAGDGLLLTGRLAARTQPWLADHRLLGTPLLPGSALVELAVRAGDEAGCGHLRELVLRRPLALPERGGVSLQITVGAAGADGARTVGIHSRPEDAPEADPWTCHAEGVLDPEPPLGAVGDPAFPAAWPPPGADPVDVTGFYPAAETAGYGYGPAFQGLRAAWRLGDEVYAEAALPEAQRADAHRYGIHPALLDAALQAAAVTADPGGGLRQPFAWTGVTLLASGATEVRVRLAPAGDGAVRLLLTDPQGQPVAEVAALAQRTVAPDRLTAPAAGPAHGTWTPLALPAQDEAAPDAAHAGTWAVLGEDPLGAGAAVQYAGQPVDAYPDLAALGAVLDAGVPAPECVLLVQDSAAHPDTSDAPGTSDGPDGPDALDGLLAAWLADDRLSATRLAVVTRGAVTTVPDPAAGDSGTHADAAAPSTAAVWHRVTAAQTAHPGRLLLVDLDPGTADGQAPEILAAALRAALDQDESRLAVHREQALVQRTADPATPSPAAPARRRAAAGAAEGPAGEALKRRLAAVPPGERARLLADLVRRQAAAVLGHASADEVGADRPFKDLGFDSMMSVRLRDRLAADTGLTLPATLAFTYPSPEALAAHLLERIGPGDDADDPGADRALAEVERLETALAALESALDGGARTRVAKRLQTVLWRWSGTAPATAQEPPAGVLDESTLRSATDDEMFDLLDRELGTP